MLTQKALKAFKKQYKEERGIELSDNEALAITLYENAVLHTQNFISRIELELGELNRDIKLELTEDIMSYSLGLILIYMGIKKEFDNLRPMVLSEYEKFIKTQSGIMNEEQNKILNQFLCEKLERNIMWLSTPFEKEAMIEKIIFGISSYTPSDKYKTTIEKLLSDVELSMMHFGIIQTNEKLKKGETKKEKREREKWEGSVDKFYKSASELQKLLEEDIQRGEKVEKSFRHFLLQIDIEKEVHEQILNWIKENALDLSNTDVENFVSRAHSKYNELQSDKKSDKNRRKFFKKQNDDKNPLDMFDGV